ncbi:hypothetical protein [Enterobacter sp. Bisph1]|uniref:hypothetical protein n=1 Tax=Enterobacter sp. Bisph1 TaxID=1274399 RepID=UPI00057C313B|nr:hypothetical protein [Enterobacter sp. Bisph1]
MGIHKSKFEESLNVNENTNALVEVVITLFSARRDIICSGIAGFLLAVLSTFYYPQQWITSVTISSPEKFTVYPLIMCLQKFYRSQGLISPEDLFTSYIYRLQTIINRNARKEVDIQLESKNDVTLSVASYGASSQILVINDLLNQANIEQNELIMEKSKCNTEIDSPLFYSVEKNAYRFYPRRISYSLRMLIGIVFGIVFASALILLNGILQKVENTWYYRQTRELMEIKNADDCQLNKLSNREELTDALLQPRQKKLSDGAVAAIAIYVMMLIVSLFWLGLEIYTGL